MSALMRWSCGVFAVLGGVLISGWSQARPDECYETQRAALEANSRDSLAHFRLGECYATRKDRAAAVNEWQAALDGDLQPSWVKVWSYLSRGKLFDCTGQRQRAILEYRRAEETHDNTQGAQEEVRKYLETPYVER